MNSRPPSPTPQLDAENPWPGLCPYEESAQSFFFGRDVETDSLFRMVRREPMVIFYGQSGLGKTSLLQAGLFPKLRNDGFVPVMVRLDYGPTAPSLAAQVKKAIGGALLSAGIDARPPTDTESLWEYFHSTEVDFWDAQNRRATLVLVFDQFEERFTLGRHSPEADNQSEAFLTELSQLIENRLPQLVQDRFDQESTTAASFDFDKRFFRVVLSLREDFLPEMDNLRARFSFTLEHSLRLKPMNEEQAQSVITGPQPSLVTGTVASEIVRFVSGSEQQQRAICTVEPVLLSVVLFELNQQRRRKGQSEITSDLLVGNRDQILAGFYEEALSGLPIQARLLVEEGLLTSANRRDSIAWENALSQYQVEESALLTLIDRHLLRREDRKEGVRLELVHDRLAEVVRQHREVRREEERRAKADQEARVREQELLRQQESQRRRVRVRVRLLSVICVLLSIFGIAMAGLGLYAWQQSSEAKRAFQESQRQRDRAEMALDNEKKQKIRAETALKDAENQRLKAEDLRKEAENQKTNTEKAFKESETSKAQAIEAGKEADEQRKNAEMARNKTEMAFQDSQKQRAKLENFMKFMNFMLQDLSDKLRPLGRLDILRDVTHQITEQVLAHYSTGGGTNESDDALFHRYTAFANLGYALALQGETTNALTAYKTCLDLAIEMDSRGNKTTNWLAETSVCHLKIGELWQSRGDSEKALGEFKIGLNIARSLTNDAPTNALWKHYLLLNYRRIGDVLWTQGDKTQAINNCTNAVEIAKSLVSMQPRNQNWMSDLLVSYNKAGSRILTELGVAKAKEFCTNGLALAEQLVKLDDRNVQWQSELSISHDNMGDVCLAYKKVTQGRNHYQTALSIRQRLVKIDPSNTEWQRGILQSYLTIYGTYSREGQLSKLGPFLGQDQNQLYSTYHKIMQDAKAWAGKDPGNSEWQNDLARCHGLLGDLLLQEDKPQAALEEYRKAVAIWEELARSDPNAMGLHYWRSLSRCNTASALRRLSRLDEAATEARQALRVFEDLLSRWPRNSLFMEGPKVGTRNLLPEIPINPKQMREVIAAFKFGFKKARSQGSLPEDDEGKRADYARYCMEKGIAYLMSGKSRQTVVDAEKAIGIWQELLRQHNTNIKNYRTNLLNARVALGAVQIVDHKPKDAVANALQGLQLDPAKTELKAILAMSYLFDKQIEKALAILNGNRDLQVGKNLRFPEAVIEDLRRLHAKGVALPDVVLPELENLEKQLTSESDRAPK